MQGRDRWAWLGVFAAILALATTACAAGNPVSGELRAQCIEVLRDGLASGATWEKVHAAEALLDLDYRAGVYEAFKAELETRGGEPEYRIGIWRVLAQAAPTTEERAQWRARIAAALADPDAPDHLHAIESLAKLGAPLEGAARHKAAGMARAGEDAVAAFAWWALLRSGETEAAAELTGLLASGEPVARLRAAYALGREPALREQTWQALRRAVDAEAQESAAYPYMLAAAFRHAPGDTLRADYHARALDLLESGEPGRVRVGALALAAAGGDGDVANLEPLLNHEDLDVRMAAALGVLRIERRRPHRLTWLDWLVIACYGAAMLWVGWYYSRRTANTEDYLLGGRSMRPLWVGLSMFASLLSTISYLAFPGEMIKHGPIIAAQYLAMPFILLAIGWLLIPRIMRLRVTTAYEILERHLGVSARLTGSLFFLALRFMWMAVIIYATSSKVLVPLFGWGQGMTPVVCAVLGLITVLYTSMGGLRAVVATDAAQTMILFGAAILTLVLISVRMGGVAAWWPDTWAPHWQPLRIWYDPDTRLTILGVMTSYFAWYLCTAGSDQVAIQRYLATRNTATGRRVLATSLLTDMTTGIFLGILGLALFGFFSSHQHLLPDTQQAFGNADSLFPRFIVMGLPAGISGLVVAGLLAAAMSSLSSGVNSTGSVIAIDFIDRFRRGGKGESESRHLRRTKAISAVIGVVVVVMSIGVNQVSGNLLEIAYKVVNLLTAPLFVLFFMAMFVPWAKSFGAIVAALCSTVVAIGIGYFSWFGLSFIWIIPCALGTGAVVGPLVSLLPIGQRRTAYTEPDDA